MGLSGGGKDADPVAVLARFAPLKNDGERDQLRQQLLKGDGLKKAVFVVRLEDLLARRGDMDGVVARLVQFRNLADRRAAAVQKDGKAWDHDMLVSGIAFVVPDVEQQRWDKIYPG